MKNDNLFRQAQAEVKASVEGISEELRVEFGSKRSQRERRIKNLQRKVFSTRAWWEE